jgi:hypothetical protein
VHGQASRAAAWAGGHKWFVWAPSILFFFYSWIWANKSTWCTWQVQDRKWAYSIIPGREMRERIWCNEDWQRKPKHSEEICPSRLRPGNKLRPPRWPPTSLYPCGKPSVGPKLPKVARSYITNLLKPLIHGNKIKKLISFLTENSLNFRYEDQPVNDI